MSNVSELKKRRFRHHSEDDSRSHPCNHYKGHRQRWAVHLDISAYLIFIKIRKDSFWAVSLLISCTQMHSKTLGCVISKIPESPFSPEKCAQELFWSFPIACTYETSESMCKDLVLTINQDSRSLLSYCMHSYGSVSQNLSHDLLISCNLQR